MNGHWASLKTTVWTEVGDVYWLSLVLTEDLLREDHGAGTCQERDAGLNSSPHARLKA